MCKGGPQDVSSRVVTAKFDGSLSSSSISNNNTWKSPYNPNDKNAPVLPTKSEIRAVIPKECFERSYFWGFYYLARDIVLSSIIVYVTSQVLSSDRPSDITDIKAMAIWVFGWAMYAFWMGSIGGALWVIGHECGHGAYFPSETVNDIVGNIIHPIFLVPYFAWQYSHAKHHRRTNHLSDGETHVPNTSAVIGIGPQNVGRKFSASAWHDFLGDAPFAALVIFLHLRFGWPAYLLGQTSTGTTKQDGTPLGKACADHFRPNSPLFSPKVRGKIVFSSIVEVACIAGLLYAGYVFGYSKVALWYLNPYLVVNAWLVLYTWLHHTDPSIPHYGEGEWTWVRGSLSTIDRPYEFFDYFHHHIGSTHVVHHLFHEIPFYHAKKATVAVKAFLEPKGLYNYDPTFFPLALWRVARKCHYVDSLEGVQYYKSFENIPRGSDKKKVL